MPAEEAAAQLAARTSSLLPRHPTVSLEAQNLSALPPAEWSSFRSLFEAQLKKAGVELAGGASSDPRLRVTLADNFRGMLLVAEVTSGDNRQVAMLPWNAPVAPEAKPRVSLTKQLIWTQGEPILDVLFFDSNSQMLVLGENKLASYRLAGGNWAPGPGSSLVLPRPMPRDPRGRLEITPGGFRAYVPGATCTGAVQPELKIACVAGNETWGDAAVRWVMDRNLLQSDEVKTPFYSSADGLFATPDGRVLNRTGQSVAGSENWGSDLAPVDDACGTGAALIATSEATDRDTVRAYNAQTAPVSDALSLAGPVTALWPSETRGQVTLVVRNAQTGEYEASRLGLACAQ
jgi:hypothetical protein